MCVFDSLGTTLNQTETELTEYWAQVAPTQTSSISKDSESKPDWTASAWPNHLGKEPSCYPGGSVRKRTHADLLQQTEHGDDSQTTIKAEPAAEEPVRGSKRSRLADWPFKAAPVAAGKQLTDRDGLRRSQSPQLIRTDRQPDWLSKFKEGSMNDKPSNQPPSEYIGHDQLIQDQLMEQFMVERQQGWARASEDTNISYSAGIQSARPSGMYRFGKALVNAFNPIMVWNGLNGRWKDKSEEELKPEKLLLDERRMKAEKAYAVLKKDGYPGTYGPDPQAASVTNMQSTVQKYDPDLMSSRDSGIDVGFDTEETFKVPQPIVGLGRSVSPSSEVNSGPKSSLRLPKPSLSSLRKIKSHLQLPSTKRHSASPAPIPSIESDGPRIVSEDNTLKRQLSKRDLHRQTKLNKKISDLETQLGKARRELLQSMDDVPPVPPLPTMRILKPFVPGSLASLPSERLLSEHLIEPMPAPPDTVTDSSEVALGARIAECAVGEQKPHCMTTPVANVLFKADASTPQRSTGKKRKSNNTDNLAYKPDVEDEPETNFLKEKMKRGRPAKAKKVQNNTGPQSSEPTRTNVGVGAALLEATNTLPKNPSTPAAVPNKDVPFNPATVDKVKLLAMRSSRDSTVPFGKLSDDIRNLKSEFPGITNDQVIKYISRLSDEEKQHPTRTSSRNVPSFEGKLETVLSSVSQKQPQDLKGLQAVPSSKPTPKFRRPSSPPPIHDNSGQANSSVHDPWIRRNEDEVIRVSPTKNPSVPPVPKVPQELENQKAKVPDEVVEREEWRWDDDVF